MTKDYKEITRDLNKSLVNLRTHAPDVMKAFGMLSQAASQESAALPAELIPQKVIFYSNCGRCRGFGSFKISRGGIGVCN